MYLYKFSLYGFKTVDILMFFLGKIEVVEIERKRSDLKLDLVYENLPWTIKYRPKSVDDIVGNRSVAEGLLSWI